MSFKAKLWLFWFVATFSSGATLVAAMLSPGHQWPFLLGETTSGHHQIELSCKACHLTPFGGKEALQKSCIRCHGAELKLADDSHPAKKFNDPRNADRLEKLDAQLCLSCHREHKPQLTGGMGVTVPQDFCQLCHADIAQERQSHRTLSFTSCADAGCHNYHDNRALFEDFLAKHVSQPTVASAVPTIPPRTNLQLTASVTSLSGQSGPLDRAMADAPPEKRSDAVLAEWFADVHSRKGVNCSGCHIEKAVSGQPKAWNDRPGPAQCRSCHANEVTSFTEGKHGMRLRADLSELGPMRPALARQPMKPAAHGRDVGCASCHGAHGFDTVKAQAEACIECHDDEHSQAFAGSPHHRLWLGETAGQSAKGSGVSCARCHMPRVSTENIAGTGVFANHNQNDNLRPNEKMIRPVCMSCHGLQFTLDALADKTLVARNFAGRPRVRVESIEWVQKRGRTGKQPRNPSKQPEKERPHDR
jgi:hypothetical protein